ncbi:patatin-like phospholipase family protein [Stakelama tenebrarum]|uniref:Patatin-like phospholipase family protein n=1 Tax=Stakelama tenebrarum TaxID=2711215 RepID=A0A6G6Y4C3_9SPHN|nr:patatin-like phospholipase family protein [Sphingosinithalassobacter tenebrarum]QIG79657.1 patatin-like phospholipase family protein [Sphingosinithalassobacter tenebrarum]
MRPIFLGLLMLVTLSGCARGALDIDCPSFETMRRDLPYSQLEREIHGLGAEQTAPAPEQAELTKRVENTLPSDYDPAHPEAPTPTPILLLLSGGGQWGAFGAGYLNELRLRSDLPEFTVITGVSTGGLQSLFISVATTEAFDGLLAAYDPVRESDVVDRNPAWQAAFRGSLAGLEPLRRRLENALCPDDRIDDPSRDCMLDGLRALKGRKTVLIGFVNAENGRFQYVDAVDLAQLPRREARTCLTGAALASAAMPVFFQQVRINGVAYYDGGVRSSVFEASVAHTAALVTERRAILDALYNRVWVDRDARLPIYVVRNGPTTVEPDPAISNQPGPLSAALRAESIVVNQLEVGSISALRIEHPRGPLLLVTADGWEEAGCVKPGGGVMFDKGFMNCLTRYGAQKARVPDPWISLSQLPLRGQEPPAPPDS